MEKLLLTNCRVVNEGVIAEQDILIEAERISALGKQLPRSGAEVIDVGGRFVLPGVIDDQVHFRDPGFPDKASIESESQAAIAGGVTSFFDMPNTKPPTVDRAALAAKRETASRTSYANYAFYLGATNDNLDEIRQVTHEDACAIKVFMGASTGNMLVDDPQALEGIFSAAKLPVVTHCEDSPMIWAAEQAHREKYGEDVPMSAHPDIRSADACYKSSSFAVELAKRHGTKLHVLHLTTAKELDLFSKGDIDDKQITVEVCVHHLWFDESRYADLGARIKCNPAIKRASDREALLRAVREDVIDIIATDHAPHTKEEKSRKYFDAPAGLPLVQHMLVALLELHKKEVFTLEQIAAKTAHNPAKLFRLLERGFIREGYYADLAIVDLDTPTRVTAEQIKYRCGWSPFEGEVFSASVWMTVLNGGVVYRDGVLSGERRAKALRFGPR